MMTALAAVLPVLPVVAIPAPAPGPAPDPAKSQVEIRGVVGNRKAYLDHEGGFYALLSMGLEPLSGSDDPVAALIAAAKVGPDPSALAMLANTLNLSLCYAPLEMQADK